jgi:hypothetical protein
VIYISHRGNLLGPNPDRENSPPYIVEALNAGYDVEVDVRLVDGVLQLGHDQPQYPTTIDFLSNPSIWVHCKDIETLDYLTHNGNVHYFWHQSDDVTLTSQGYCWTYPGRQLITGGIAVLPELYPNWDILLAGGICSDSIGNYRS